MKLPCPPNACPMDSITDLLSGPWTTYIVWVLHEHGDMRFGALKRQVSGVSTRMLTARLRHLEAFGLVHRHVEPTSPPQVTYSLTARGAELAAALRDLNELARRWQAEDVRVAAE